MSCEHSRWMLLARYSILYHLHYYAKVSRRLDHARIMAWCKAGSYPGPSRGSISVLYASQSANYSKQVVDNVLKEPNQPDVVLYNRARVSPLSPLFLEFS